MLETVEVLMVVGEMACHGVAQHVRYRSVLGLRQLQVIDKIHHQRASTGLKSVIASLCFAVTLFRKKRIHLDL